MAKNVILDALISREDFEVTDEAAGTTRNISTIGARDLEYDSFFFSALRKPDFQRETSEWDRNRIVSLIESFINGDLIPAVILWRSSSSYTFVIDGAHRLSAIAAWINNDYGDGLISKEFYDGVIPEEQIAVAEDTRKAIRKSIGLFSDYQLALRNPEKVESSIAKKAKSLGALAIQVQWVEGDAKKAESSFFKINQQAAAIDKTELKLLKSRRKPSGIATRAILRSGKGHKYWSSYDDSIQADIQALAHEINEIVFQPSLKNPVKSLDLPLGGKNFSSQGQSLILELVAKSNRVKDHESENDDNDGVSTVKHLQNCLRVVRRLNSTHPSSLGLHPAVYFYSRDGRHKPASFWASINLIQYLESKERFSWFTDVRDKFELFLRKFDYIIQQFVRKYRSASAAYPQVCKMYIFVLECLHDDVPVELLPQKIKATKEFSFITLDDDGESVSSNNFSKGRKSEVFMVTALETAIRCKICNGYLHQNSISVDHVKRKQDGGIGTVENGQLTHPYCNTTYKN